MKILLVDDSIVVRNILRNIFKNENDMIVIGESSNGEDAVYKADKLKPDIIIMDIDMPIMDGLEATKIIMKKTPVPIMVFSQQDDEATAFKAIKNGACDFTNKPSLEKLNDYAYKTEFIEKLKLLAATTLQAPTYSLPSTPITVESGKIFDIIVAGASTGGPSAVLTLITELPKNLPIPMVIVQHIENDFDKGYVEWLENESGKKVVLAKNGMALEPSVIYVAPTNKHFLFRGLSVLLDDSPKVLNQKPSIDVTFCSANENFGAKVIGILLTGMGTDGANGCVAIRNGGGTTLVQDKSTSLIYGMPRAAFERGGASLVLPLFEMSKTVEALLAGICDEH